MLRDQMLGDMRGICEAPGNHDWRTRASSAFTGQIPSGYEAFWKMFPPPNSRQPIDVNKKGGARYEHLIDLAGWRFVFLDTGPCEDIQPWPTGDASRVTWLRQALDTPGRAKIVCAHHSRLSRGKHGDIEEVDAVWQTLFTETGAPRVAMTLGGHDHNVSAYAPRSQARTVTVPPAEGIHVVVNGAGGRGHDLGFRGTRPELFFEEDQVLPHTHHARRRTIRPRGLPGFRSAEGSAGEPDAGIAAQAFDPGVSATRANGRRLSSHVSTRWRLA